LLATIIAIITLKRSRLWCDHLLAKHQVRRCQPHTLQRKQQQHSQSQQSQPSAPREHIMLQQTN
jgi:hypothetical protein